MRKNTGKTRAGARTRKTPRLVQDAFDMHVEDVRDTALRQARHNTDKPKTDPDPATPDGGDEGTDGEETASLLARAARLDRLADREQARRVYSELVSSIMILARQFARVMPQDTDGDRPVPPPLPTPIGLGRIPRPARAREDRPPRKETDRHENDHEEPAAVTRQFPRIRTSEKVKELRSRKDILHAIGVKANTRAGRAVVKGLPVPDDKDKDSDEE